MPAAKPEYTNYSMFVDARFEKVCHNDKGTFLLVLRVSRFFWNSECLKMKDSQKTVNGSSI